MHFALTYRLESLSGRVNPSLKLTQSSNYSTTRVNCPVSRSYEFAVRVLFMVASFSRDFSTKSTCQFSLEKKINMYETPQNNRCCRMIESSCVNIHLRFFDRFEADFSIMIICPIIISFLFFVYHI